MFGKSQEVNESSKEVPVLTRVGILEIKKDDINYTFGEIPDINVDMKSLIEIVIDYDFQMEIVEGNDKDEFKQVVRDLKSKLSKINLDYESFDTVANTLDKDNIHGLGDVIKKLYNRILFFQLDSLLLDYARYVFSYYAIMQLNSVKNIMKKFYSSKSNDIAAKDLSGLEFMSADSSQIKDLVGNLDQRIEQHKEDLQTKKSMKDSTPQVSADQKPAVEKVAETVPSALDSDAFVTPESQTPQQKEQQKEQKEEAPFSFQQQAGSTGLNPIQDLKAKFTERQTTFIKQRGEFKEFINMLLDLLSNYLNRVIEHYKTTLDEINVDEELKKSLSDIMDKLDPLKSGYYHIKDENSIDADLQNIEQNLIDQLGKRGSIRYTKLYQDIEQIASNIQGIHEVTAN